MVTQTCSYFIPLSAGWQKCIVFFKKVLNVTFFTQSLTKIMKITVLNVTGSLKGVQKMNTNVG